MPVSKIEDAIEDIRAGKMVIVVDDEDRENEGDLAMSAEKITPAAINFMATYGRGLICVPMLGPRLEQLRLPMMTQDNTARLSTAFTVSVDVLKGATTGISAADRSFLMTFRHEIRQKLFEIVFLSFLVILETFFAPKTKSSPHKLFQWGEKKVCCRVVQ